MRNTRYHLGLDAEREGKMSAPYQMSMVHVTFEDGGRTVDTWKHVATHAIERLTKEYGWTVLEIEAL